MPFRMLVGLTNSSVLKTGGQTSSRPRRDIMLFTPCFLTVTQPPKSVLRDSETFGVEKGRADEVIRWINNASKDGNLKFEARKYDHEVTTNNFGTFEMFSWIGDVQHARRLIIKAGKRFRVKTIEGGYKTKEKTFSIKKIDYAMVRRGDKIIGKLQFEASRFGNNRWDVKAEERG